MKFCREYKDKEIKQIIKSIVILVDTREQVNSHLKMYFKSNKINFIDYKLDYGDYSFMIPKNESLDILEDIYFIDEIVIERKANAEEISNNFAKGRERFHKEFSPNGTNVNFVQITDSNTIFVRTYERGVEDETLACGTGVTASSIISVIKKKVVSPVHIVTRGKDNLFVSCLVDNLNISDVYLEGPAIVSFIGTVIVG